MENLPSNMSDFKNLNPAQKALAVAIALVAFAVIISTGIWAFPILTQFVTSADDLLWKTLRFAAVAIPTAWFAWYAITHPFMISSMSAKLSWALTVFFIKMDRLSVMDRRADYLAQKVKNVTEIKTRLSTRYNIATKEIDALKESIAKNKRLGSAALDEGDKKQASLFGFKVTTDLNSLNSRQPDVVRLKTNIEFLGEQAENWQFGVDTLRYFITSKKAEYQTKKEMAEAVGELQEFINGDTESAKAYDEALRQVDELCATYTAQVDEFENKTKDLMNGVKIEKRMFENEGLAAIEEFRKNGGLKLPDFTTVLTDGKTPELSANTNTSKYTFNT